MATSEADRTRAELLQAVAAEYSGLLNLRFQVGSEVSFRASLYFTVLSASIIALGFVGQRGQLLSLFALVILPVIFILGLFTYGRMLQGGVLFIVSGHGVDRIRRFYREIDTAHSELFHEIYPIDSGLMALGIFNLRWQGFLATTTTVAIVNAAVGGTAVAVLVESIAAPPEWAAVALGILVALGVSAAFWVHQVRTWRRLAAALPGLIRERTRGSSPQPVRSTHARS